MKTETTTLAILELETLATVIGGAHTTAAMSSQALSEASQPVTRNPAYVGSGAFGDGSSGGGGGGGGGGGW